jgi:hypothetical protein
MQPENSGQKAKLQGEGPAKQNSRSMLAFGISRIFSGPIMEAASQCSRAF